MHAFEVTGDGTVAAGR